MKKFINKVIYVFITALVVFSCTEDKILFLEDNGQTALSFETTDYDISIPEEDLSLEIPVAVTTSSDVSRTFTAEILTATDGTSGEYTIGNIVIPANEFSGILTVDFDFSEIGGLDGTVKELDIVIVTPEGVASYKNVVSIMYFREIVCNDLTLTIVSDVWATETSFSLEDENGMLIVEDFFPFSGIAPDPQTISLDFNLPNGTYKLIMKDEYCDGQLGSGFGVTLTGYYSLTCSIITHASNSGNWGCEDITEFTVNP